MFCWREYQEWCVAGHWNWGYKAESHSVSTYWYSIHIHSSKYKIPESFQLQHFNSNALVCGNMKQRYKLWVYLAFNVLGSISLWQAHMHGGQSKKNLRSTDKETRNSDLWKRTWLLAENVCGKSITVTCKPEIYIDFSKVLTIIDFVIFVSLVCTTSQKRLMSNISI